MPDSVISLRGATKSYGAFRVGPVDLAIEPGYVAMVGPNGSGKSTLFRLLMGLAHPEFGEVRLFGRVHADDHVGIAARIGYVPEPSIGHDRMTIGDLGRFAARWYPGWDAGRFEASVDAMATQPELLLCDELTDGVDPFARREILAGIARFMEIGDRTVVFATHHMDEVQRLADYVVFLVDGAFLGMFEKDALLDDWRRMWVSGTPAAGTPGVVRLDREHPASLVSSQWWETAAALQE